MEDKQQYTALYRRLRPQNFKDVVGQDHIVRTLMNQLKSGRVSHAYLICGTRGTGKTSTAKLLARAVNCQSPDDGEPCNVCPMCQAVLAGRSMNVIEIDAASNNGVDNIRDIRDEVRYPPTEGIYKVYIIDEVHMLSTGAFNALLKTLEEPPEHVIFILATTDPQKVPSTIHSRCQRFDFKRIKLPDMFHAIRGYADAENITIDDNAIRYLASISDGSMRDALSILDQCISFYMDEKISLDKLQEITGSADSSVFFDMTDALSNYDGSRCLQIIEDLSLSGRDIGQFVSELLTHFRNLLVAAMLDNETAAMDLSGDTYEKLRKQGSAIGSGILIGYINALSQLAGQLRYALNGRILFEVACIRLCNPYVEDSNETVFSRLKKLENAMSKRSVPVVQEPQSPQIIAAPVSTKIKKALPDDIKAVKESWREFAGSFDNPIKSFLSMSAVGYLEGNILVILTKDASSRGFLRGREDFIREKLTQRYKVDFPLIFMSQEEYDIKHSDLFGEKDTEVDFNKKISEKVNIDIIFEEE